MFSVKKSVLQTVALLKAYGVKQIVLSPGSRNAPLMQTFSQDSFFECHTIVDERNAAFYALGIIQALQRPVAICCTSGSALLNYAPAISEAYYQQLPLIVISADRSPEWIGQMDGQTIPQANAFGSLSKKSVNLPEIKTEADEWFCNRLINEALIACTADASGPVHINIPLYEPLFDYSEKELPQVRKIEYARLKKSVDINPFVEKWNTLPKKLIIVGQLFYTLELIKLLERITEHTNCIVFAESLSNCNSDSFINNFDVLLSAIPEDQKESFSPDLVITLGGHIVSKRLKQFIRQHKPTNHWHLTESGEVVDLFQSLTDLIETDTIDFFTQLSSEIKEEKENPFFCLWKNASKQIPEPTDKTLFSDISATGYFLKTLPKNSVLHLANSSAVRNVQLFNLDKSIRIYCNRGTNGIESTLPSVVGFASVHKDPVYLIIGDLSFFYGVNSLWNMQHIKNLRILLINNGGGGIFHVLPGLNQAASLKDYVSAEHSINAKKWAEAAGLQYLSANNKKELDNKLEILHNAKTNQSVLFEISIKIETSTQVFQEYYQKLKKLI